MSRGESSSKDLDHIDEIVRRAYEEFLNEELPDRLATLLERLREGEFTGGDVSSGENG